MTKNLLITGLLYCASIAGFAQSALKSVEWSLIASLQTDHRLVLQNNEFKNKHTEKFGIGYSIGISAQHFIAKETLLEMQVLFTKKTYRIGSENAGYEQGPQRVSSLDNYQYVAMNATGGLATYKTVQFPLKFNFNYNLNADNWYQHVALVPELLVGSKYKGANFGYNDFSRLNIANMGLKFGLGKRIDMQNDSYINIEPFVYVPLTSYGAGTKKIYTASAGILVSL